MLYHWLRPYLDNKFTDPTTGNIRKKKKALVAAGSAANTSKSIN